MICQLFFFPSSQSEQFGQKCESFKRVDGDHLTLIMEVIVDAFSPLFNYCHSSCKLVDRGFVNDIIGLVLDNEPLVTLHRLATQMILTTAALSQTEECNRWFSRPTITLVFFFCSWFFQTDGIHSDQHRKVILRVLAVWVSGWQCRVDGSSLWSKTETS